MVFGYCHVTKTFHRLFREKTSWEKGSLSASATAWVLLNKKAKCWFMVGSWSSASCPEEGQRAWVKSHMCTGKGINLATVTSPENWP